MISVRSTYNTQQCERNLLTITIEMGVPHGSIMGPLFYSYIIQNLS